MCSLIDNEGVSLSASGTSLLWDARHQASGIQSVGTWEGRNVDCSSVVCMANLHLLGPMHSRIDSFETKTQPSEARMALSCLRA